MDSLVSRKYRNEMVHKTDPPRTLSEDLSKSERTREGILSAAARLFRYEGYHATTMRDIAQEAGIEAGSIYYHFQSKDQILSDVLDLGNAWGLFPPNPNIHLIHLWKNFLP